MKIRRTFCNGIARSGRAVQDFLARGLDDTHDATVKRWRRVGSGWSKKLTVLNADGDIEVAQKIQRADIRL